MNKRQAKKLISALDSSVFYLLDGDLLIMKNVLIESGTKNLSYSESRLQNSLSIAELKVTSR